MENLRNGGSLGMELPKSSDGFDQVGIVVGDTAVEQLPQNGEGPPLHAQTQIGGQG